MSASSLVYLHVAPIVAPIPESLLGVRAGNAMPKQRDLQGRADTLRGPESWRPHPPPPRLYRRRYDRCDRADCGYVAWINRARSHVLISLPMSLSSSNPFADSAAKSPMPAPYNCVAGLMLTRGIRRRSQRFCIWIRAVIRGGLVELWMTLSTMGQYFGQSLTRNF